VQHQQLAPAVLQMHTLKDSRRVMLHQSARQQSLWLLGV
jgi:hypothetical protein